MISFVVKFTFKYKAIEMSIESLAKRHVTSTPKATIVPASTMSLQMASAAFKVGWNKGRLPTEEERDSTWKNTGEYLFLVVIPNPNKKHAVANKRPFIVREGVLSFDMDKEQWYWSVGDENAVWHQIEPIAWQCLPNLY